MNRSDQTRTSHHVPRSISGNEYAWEACSHIGFRKPLDVLATKVVPLESACHLLTHHLIDHALLHPNKL
jgi:hypothetical protein